MSDDSKHAKRKRDEQEAEDKGRSAVEWITLGLSAAILLSIVGTITWLSFRGPEKPAIIVVEPQMDQVREDETGYYLPVVIRNDGDTTVAGAVIQGELDTGSGPPETAEITVDFLDGGEVVAGTFVFRSDPASGDLTAGVTSYQEP